MSLPTRIDSDRRQWLTETSVAGGAGLVATAVPFVVSKAPSERTRALGPTGHRKRSDSRPAACTRWSGTPKCTGLFVALFGEGVVHRPTIFSLALFPVIGLVYGLLALREEMRVLAEFGDEYRASQRRVPMFMPRFGQWGQFVERSS